MQEHTRHLSNWSQWGIQWIEHLRRQHRFNRELERHMHKFEEAFSQIGRRANSLKNEESATAIPALMQQAEAVQQQFHQFLRLIQDREKQEPEVSQSVYPPARQPAPVPIARPVPIGKHTLPPIPYAYDALEPYIDAETMRIHHDKLHRKYVEDLNKAESKLAEARARNDFELVRHWERELAFNGAGHYLHTIFWNVMSPEGGGEPTGDLARQLARDFGSFAAFQAHFSQAAEKVEGPGWAILVWSPRAQHLEILQAEKHQNLSQWDVIPLLVLDVWEHSYFLRYKNDRAHYVENWWKLVNWPYVEERFQQARNLRWQPF
ncbi:superoxide dismutase [Brevibacillus borstelensis]|uniref:superoxide dismutase n=1 Tax=Brevibacillus TaxID=55080 RepID=UPI001562149B|nr:superoxide dismutase [Brevibacillus borstelensis]MBE5397176.1 superoxide dismutase [Brevibacillus borstelensis]MED1874802.1 superoxide dismutase [Brevibacillus borstelensis]MED2007298.1 superoxide dismutase [Brevibacillus borstelensis]